MIRTMIGKFPQAFKFALKTCWMIRDWVEKVRSDDRYGYAQEQMKRLSACWMKS